MESSITNSVTSEKYLRIASISVATYDYILTLPAEWRFYRNQSSIFHLSLACVLFILIRAATLVSLLWSSAIMDTSPPPIRNKRVNNTILWRLSSKVTLGVRTFHIAKRERRIGILLLLLYLLSTSAEWFTDLFHGTQPTASVVDGNCTLTNSGKILSTWFYYLAVILYDVVIVTISTMHLLRYNPLSSRVEQLIRVLIYDGIGYFIVLSASNVLNLVFYHTPNIQTQTAGASVGYAVTWIMTQRILINVRENIKPDPQHLENVIVARPTHGAQKKMSGLRSQFEPKSHSKGSTSKSAGDAEFRPPSHCTSNDMELDIHVRVERSVMVDYKDEPEHSSSWAE
ncbi:hypothetical protein C8R48DRAFT_761128 [Suillus tomentosus]|nr:hypothetical protein C8R48DRAFT_761128 [Suillus tomentosus]